MGVFRSRAPIIPALLQRSPRPSPALHPPPDHGARTPQWCASHSPPRGGGVSLSHLLTLPQGSPPTTAFSEGPMRASPRLCLGPPPQLESLWPGSLLSLKPSAAPNYLLCRSQPACCHDTRTQAMLPKHSHPQRLTVRALAQTALSHLGLEAHVWFAAMSTSAFLSYRGTLLTRHARSYHPRPLGSSCLRSCHPLALLALCGVVSMMSEKEG